MSTFTSRLIADLRGIHALALADTAAALRAYHRGTLRNLDEPFLRQRMAGIAERELRDAAASVIEESVSMPLARYSLAALVPPPAFPLVAPPAGGLASPRRTLPGATPSRPYASEPNALEPQP